MGRSVPQVSPFGTRGKGVEFYTIGLPHIVRRTSAVVSPSVEGLPVVLPSKDLFLWSSTRNVFSPTHRSFPSGPLRKLLGGGRVRSRARKMVPVDLGVRHVRRI